MVLKFGSSLELPIELGKHRDANVSDLESEKGSWVNSVGSWVKTCSEHLHLITNN